MCKDFHVVFWNKSHGRAVDKVAVFWYMAACRQEEKHPPSSPTGPPAAPAGASPGSAPCTPRPTACTSDRNSGRYPDRPPDLPPSADEFLSSNKPFPYSFWHTSFLGDDGLALIQNRKYLTIYAYTLIVLSRPIHERMIELNHVPCSFAMLNWHRRAHPLHIWQMELPYLWGGLSWALWRRI